MFYYILDEGASSALVSCLEVGNNFNPRLRTSSSVWESWVTERLNTVSRVESVFFLGRRTSSGVHEGEVKWSVVIGGRKGICFPGGLQISFFDS